MLPELLVDVFSAELEEVVVKALDDVVAVLDWLVLVGVLDDTVITENELEAGEEADVVSTADSCDWLAVCCPNSEVTEVKTDIASDIKLPKRFVDCADA